MFVSGLGYRWCQKFMLQATEDD